MYRKMNRALCTTPRWRSPVASRGYMKVRELVAYIHLFSSCSASALISPMLIQETGLPRIEAVRRGYGIRVEITYNKNGSNSRWCSPPAAHRNAPVDFILQLISDCPPASPSACLDHIAQAVPLGVIPHQHLFRPCPRCLNGHPPPTAEMSVSGSGMHLRI